MAISRIVVVLLLLLFDLRILEGAQFDPTELDHETDVILITAVQISAFNNFLAW